ncbi:MAG: GNAT family N-acetyltransferase, partial [Gemmataceae bacterium]
DPASQGQGIGRKLLEFVEEQCRAVQARHLLIETSSTPIYEPTRQFYLKCGYEQVAQIPDFYCDGDDKVIFARRLTERLS